jgi:hypothetical protein
MNTSILQIIFNGAAPEALFDQVEHDLVALSTAALDEDELVPTEVVDEFATEFLMDWTRPPK